MLRSDYCSLHDQDDMQLQDLGECPYDQVIATVNVTNYPVTCCALQLNVVLIGSLNMLTWLGQLTQLYGCMHQKLLPCTCMCKLAT